jgi:hypothetical protein
MGSEQIIRETAIKLGAKPRAVAKWRQRGVPWKWRLLIAEEAGISREEVEAFKIQKDAS